MLDNVDQGLMKNRQIDLLDRMTEKGAGKKKGESFSPHSDVTRNLFAYNPRKKFRNFLVKLSASHCHWS